MCSEMLKYARRFNYPRLELIHSFCEDIPLDSGSIDTVVINDTFPHFNDRKIALEEIRRVLKKAGYLYLIHTSSNKKVRTPYPVEFTKRPIYKISSCRYRGTWFRFHLIYHKDSEQFD